MKTYTHIRLEVDEDFANRIYELQEFLSKRLGKKMAKAAIIIDLCKMVFDEKENLTEILLKKIMSKGFVPKRYFGKYYSCSNMHRTLEFREENIREREIRLQNGEAELEKAKQVYNVGLREMQALHHKILELNSEISNLKSQKASLEYDLKSEKRKNERLETRVESLKMQ
ncbi:MAG: hypothetical protein C0592_08070 [Marinilabiliales bacterium]|nr:MAG: hypothetical protein C0592_08070 [Marinilabiliales bacterium]